MPWSLHRIFCAAPDGLEDERRDFYDLVSEINSKSGTARGVLFVPVSIDLRMRKLKACWTAIEQNIRDASFYLQILAGSFGSPERNFAPLLETACACMAPSRITVLLKALPPGEAVDAEAGAFRSELQRGGRLPWFEFGDAGEFRARVRAVLGGWLEQIASFELRPATAEDEAFVYELVTGAMAERLAAWAWEPGSRETLLRMQYEAFRRGYAERFPNAEHSIVVVQGLPVGHTIIARSAEEIRIVDITLAPDRRGAGLGGAVLATYLEEVDRTRRRARLHVALANPAIRLYQRFGFTPVGGDGVTLELERQPVETSQL